MTNYSYRPNSTEGFDVIRPDGSVADWCATEGDARYTVAMLNDWQRMKVRGY